MLIRLFLPSLTLMVVGLSLFEPRSLNYALAAGGGGEALASLIVLALLAVAALADALVNDVLPPRYVLPWGRRYRHLVWAGMGCIFAAYAHILERQDDGHWLAATYAVYAIGCMAVAYRDLKHRAAS